MAAVTDKNKDAHEKADSERSLMQRDVLTVTSHHNSVTYVFLYLYLLQVLILKFCLSFYLVMVILVVLVMVRILYATGYPVSRYQVCDIAWKTSHTRGLIRSMFFRLSPARPVVFYLEIILMKFISRFNRNKNRYIHVLTFPLYYKF